MIRFEKVKMFPKNFKLPSSMSGGSPPTKTFLE